MSETVEQIIERIISREGAFVNHPADRGGATRWGVTQRALSEYRGSVASVADVRALTKAEAATIFRTRYIDRAGLRVLGAHPALLELMADCAVHHGQQRAIRWLQTALGGVLIDGVIGAETTSALLTRGSERELYRKVLADRARFIGRLVTANRSQAVFAAGWNARLASFVEATP